jgi:hypothetical protein
MVRSKTVNSDQWLVVSFEVGIIRIRHTPQEVNLSALLQQQAVAAKLITDH